MELIPIKTRIFQPPKDDMYTLFDAYLTDLEEGDIVLVTSKIVAIHQGRCVLPGTVNKKDLIMKESDYYSDNLDSPYPLTIKYNTFVASGGIDDSNAKGHLILLPENPFEEAQKIREYLKKENSLQDLGVIITDSNSLPFRYGTVSVTIGYCGFEPVNFYTGKKDLFGRLLKFSRTNITDSIAAGASAVSGEGDESIPIVIARNVPNVVFTEECNKEDFFIPLEDDLYYPLLKGLYE